MSAIRARRGNIGSRRFSGSGVAAGGITGQRGSRFNVVPDSAKNGNGRTVAPDSTVGVCCEDMYRKALYTNGVFAGSDT